jgi:hypothetical protein
MRRLCLTQPFNRVALVFEVGHKVIELFDTQGSDLGKAVEPTLRMVNKWYDQPLIMAPEITIPAVDDGDLIRHEWAIASDVVKELWPVFRDRFQDQA